ncbi:hypothetical protein DUI87_34442 [Hirundo rustica rustica]|uniref:G-protein coupled receptors family 1 profile domain-containing protein n=1 Tax=Hirundo rustica rustica TaxID=333673 RepID=A0A3M0IM88_HIRRU|nr:hypothetical protein DUI87_34442 [Hirundo rustica rustica]
MSGLNLKNLMKRNRNCTGPVQFWSPWPATAISNSSSISHFLLLALPDTRQLQLLHFCFFLGIFLAALLGNSLIMSATTACGHHLHTPMFFFLLNLALTHLGSICANVPKAMYSSLWDTMLGAPFQELKFSGIQVVLEFWPSAKLCAKRKKRPSL